MRLVGSAAFKAVGTSDPRPAGSIPVHLRHSLLLIARRVAVVAAVALFLAPAGIARADAARPGNTQSIVESVDPASDAVRFDVVGSDAFMRVRASQGHTVEIAGYEGEPFVKIDRSGTVWVNDASTTLAISASRYGSATSSETAARSTKQAVKWTRVRGDGTYLWHDHRVHWMSPTTPPTVDASGLVQKWILKATVDGVPTIVSGSLYLRSTPGSWWWSAAFVACVAALFASRRVRLLVLATGGVVATLIGALAFWGMPSGSRPSPTLFVLGIAALVLVMVARILRRQTEIVDALAASSGVALVVLVVLARDFVTQRFVPGIGDEWWIRFVVPAVAGAAIAVSVTSMRALLAAPKK